MRRADGLGGFGVALHPFSKGGKRDRAERSIPAAIRRGGGGTEFRLGGESSYPRTEFRPPEEKADTPELGSTLGGESSSMELSSALGGGSKVPPEPSSVIQMRKQLAPELSSALG